MCFSLIHLHLWIFLSYKAPEYLTPACSRQQESLTRHNFNAWCDQMKQPRRHFLYTSGFTIGVSQVEMNRSVYRYENSWIPPILINWKLTQSSEIKQVANTCCLPFWDFNRTTSSGLRSSISINSYKGMHYLRLSISSHCLVFWNRSCSL